MTRCQVWTSGFVKDTGALNEDRYVEYNPKLIFQGDIDFGRGGRPECPFITIPDREGRKRNLRVLGDRNALDVTSEDAFLSVTVSADFDTYLMFEDQLDLDDAEIVPETAQAEQVVPILEAGGEVVDSDETIPEA